MRRAGSTPEDPRRPAAGLRWLAAGAGLWLAAGVATWPSALTFFDEIGYAGTGRLILQGSLTPAVDSPGIWLPPALGQIPRYPPFPSLLLAPFLAVHPRAVFALGIACAILTAVLAGRAYAEWGVRPVWGLLVLLHPSLVLYARTAMADLPLAAFSVLAWRSLRRGNRVGSVAWVALVVAAKPTGVLVAAGLILGEILRRVPEAGGIFAAVRSQRWAACGALLGSGLVAALNLAATGGIRYAYAEALRETDVFSLSHLATSGVGLLAALLLVPPGLVAGAWPLWGRREYGPLAVIVLLVGGMSSYYFVDRGVTPWETLVLAPRLVTPALVFLLIGYGLLWDGIARRIRPAVLVATTLCVAAPVVAVAIGAKHCQLQRVHAEARGVAENRLRELGAPVLGATYSGLKSALLSRHEVRLYHPEASSPAVVLCGTRIFSRRDAGTRNDCDFPGFRVSDDLGSYRVLVRVDPR